jgi:hypothetical protein
MPKERFDNADQHGDSKQFHTELRWDRLGYCQIATLKENPEPPAGAIPLPGTEGWFVNLDRASINRLIRALRKARDQAFGADA